MTNEELRNRIVDALHNHVRPREWAEEITDAVFLPELERVEAERDRFVGAGKAMVVQFDLLRGERDRLRTENARFAGARREWGVVHGADFEEADNQAHAEEVALAHRSPPVATVVTRLVTDWRSPALPPGRCAPGTCQLGRCSVQENLCGGCCSCLGGCLNEEGAPG